MRLKWFNIHAFNVTAILFLLIALVSRIPVNLHFLNPLKNRLEDYQVTDIVYSQMRAPLREPESRIVLVNVGRPDRERIAAALDRVLDAGPRVVGVDILFPEWKGTRGDTLLARALELGGDRVVLAATLPEPRPLEGMFPYLETSDPAFARHNRAGFINFPANKTRTIRYFSPEERTPEGPVSAFALELVRTADPAAFDRLKARGRVLEHIHYTAEEDHFFRVEIDHLLDSGFNTSAVMQDRLVIFGYSGNDDWDAPPLDKHFTPLNDQYAGKSLPDMYGYAIHANIVRMVLDDLYVRKVPAWLNFLLAFLICYLHVLLPMWIHGRYYTVYYLASRLLQIVQFVLLFFAVTWLFDRYLLEWDFSRGFLALAMVVDAQVIYTALLKHYRHRRIRRRRKQPETGQGNPRGDDQIQSDRPGPDELTLI
jgi:CHASE2 domain-containing sensor protein